jgi:hypothetical protein
VEYSAAMNKLEGKFNNKRREIKENGAKAKKSFLKSLSRAEKTKTNY